ALAFRDLAELDGAIDFADDRGFVRLAGFEQFDHARQTTGDVFGLGGFARDLGQHIARKYRVAIGHHKVSAGRHQVPFVGLSALDHDCRLALLVRRIGHDVTRQSGHLVDFFVERDALLQVFELHRAADFGQDREGVRIPLDHDLSECDLVAFVDLHLGAVHDRIALALAALVVDHGNRALAVHHHQVSGLGLNRLQADEADCAVALGIQPRLLGDSRRRTTDVEGTHRELGSGLADRLRSDDSGCFAEFHQAPGSQVASVAHDANAALRFAGQHGADLHPLDTRSLDRACEIFRDLLVDVDDDVAVIVFYLFERDAADDTVAERLDDLAGFDDTGDVNAVHGAAIVFADDDILRHVNQTTGQVAGVSGLESGVSQSFTSAVGRDEVLQHGQAFTEVRRDRGLDDFARRLGHQSTHAGELADLLFRSASAGVGHDVNRIDRAFLVALLHLPEHLFRDLFRNRRPDFDDLVVAFAVGDGAVQVLLLDVDHLLFGVADQGLLVVRNDHVVDADREARLGRESEPKRLDLVEHLDRGLEAETQVAVVHQLP